MPATITPVIAREAFLAAADELVARMGQKAAYHFMLQAAFAVGARPIPPLTRKKLRNLTQRQCAEAHAEAMEFLRP